MTRRVLAMLLVLLMVVAMVPTEAFATDSDIRETEYTDPSINSEPETIPEETNGQPVETTTPETENIRQPDDLERNDPDPDGQMDHPVQANDAISVQVSAGAVFTDGKWVWTPQTNTAGHRFIFGINYSSSGIGEIQPGELQIRIPKNVILDRNGDPADELELSIPSEEETRDLATEEELEQIDLVWREDGDEILIFNYKAVSAAENGYIEVAYAMTEKVVMYQDMGESAPFYAKYNVIINEEEIAAESEELHVHIDTHAKVGSTSKRWPTYYTNWSTSWGQAPEDADDYTYLVWEIRTLINEDSNQPYDLIFEDTILSSSNGGEEVVGFKLAGQTEYSDLNHVEGQTATGYRYDYVLTRRPKEAFQGLTQWDVTNQIQVTLHPADNIDADNTVKSQKKFVWEKPSFDSPTGSFKIYKRADGAFRNDSNDQWLKAPGLVAGEYSRYDLNDFYEGDIERLDNLDYALWIRGYPYPWTIQEGANPQDPASYGVNPVKYVLIDNGIEVHDDETEILDVGYGDYQIDYITYSVNIKDAVYNETTMKFTESAPTYKDSDIVSFYGKFADSDEWVLIATRNLKTRENWFDPLYVRSMTASKITLQDDCLTFKVELENAHFYTCVTAVPNFALKNSDSVIAFCFEKNEISVLNRAEGHIYDYRGNEILHDEEEDYDYARSTKRDSSLEKKVVASTNVPRKKAYVISWRIKESELATYGSEGAKEYIRQQSGVFYDLLPEGCILDLTSVAVQGEDTYLSDTAFTVTQLPNYKNSGRTMLIVTVHESARYYTLYFDTIHPWESIKDHGHDVYNPVAYETGNDDIAMGYPDNGGAKNLEDNVTWNDEDMFSDQEFTDYFTDLDQETNDPKFIYAENTYDISAITTAAAGLTKRVRGVEDTKWAYEAWTTIGGDYQYRLRFMNTYTSIAKDLIFYDSIENYTAEDVVSDWHGILQSIDLSQLEEKGVAPVVYISEIEGLDLEGETNFIPNNDLTNEDIWTVWDGTTSLVNVKAIAIDMRMNNTEEPFILNPGESVVVTLHFKAPESATSQGTYPETYNNVYVSDTIVSLLGNETPFFIHQDYTTVRYVVTADIPLRKVSAENENIRVPGIQFKLYGTSDYGNEVSQILTTDRNGEIRFENIEKGHYILQEYETNDDWLFDGTEHQIVVDGEGHVWSDGAAITDSPIIIENTPRIHGDIRIIKSPEDLSRDWSTVDGTGEESGDVGEPVEPIDTNDTEEVEPASAQAETSVEYASGIPGTTFKLSGISVYGTEVMMLETTNATGRIVFRNVEQGTYTLEEVIPNENFVQNTSKWTVIIDETGAANIREPEEENRDRLYFVTPTNQSFSLENENRFWDFKLYKIDSYNRTIFLEGATFTLIGTSDFGTQYNLTETTNNQGYVRFMHLEKGSYILRETVAPTGVDENGQLGGNRNYILDAADHIVQINERGIVTIDGAVLTENGELGILNDRAMDGTITITKIWNDYIDNDDRPIPKLHLSTREIAINRNLTVNVNWSGENDSPETRPSSIRLYVGTADGTVISDKTEILSAPGNPTSIKMTALLDPNETYYVWADNARGYESLITIDSKNQLTMVDGKWTGEVSMRKYPPTYLTYKAAHVASNPGSLIITKPSGLVFFPVGVQERVLNDFEDVNEDPTAITDVPDLPMDETDPEPDIAGGTFQGLAWRITSDGELIIGAEGETQTIPQNTARSKAFFPWHAYANQVNSISFRGSVTTTWQMLYAFADLKITEFNSTNLDTSHVTNFGETFMGCSKLQHFDFTGMDTTKVTSTYEMFSGCSSLETVDLSDFVGAPLRTTANMFSGCSKLNNINFTNFNTSNVNDMKGMFKGCSSLISLDLTMLNTSNVTNMGDMFYNCSMLTTIDVSSFNTSKVTNMANMFNGCASIETLDLSSWNTEKVTTMAGMFNRCKKLVLLNVSGFDTSKVTTMASMFSGCSSLTSLDLTPLNTEKVTTMASMFSGCSSLTSLDVSPLNTSNVKNMASMFASTTALRELDLTPLETGAVTSMGSMFSGSGLDSVDITTFDCTNVTSMVSMFAKMPNCTEINLTGIQTPKLTEIGSMFMSSKKITDLDLSSMDVSKVTSMQSVWEGCSGLQNLDVSTWNTASLTRLVNTFAGCTSLKNLDLSSWDTSKVNIMQYMMSGIKVEETLNLKNWKMSQVTGSIDQAFGLRNAPNVLVFSDDMRFSGTGFSGSTKYIHKTDGAGNRLYEQQPKTMSQIAALPKEEVAGKWVKDGYIPGINSLGDGDYEYVSQDDEWIKNGNVWTYTFDVFDDSIPYFLVEEPIEGYDSPAMYTSIQINANGEVTKMATIVNTAEMKTGSLEVAKQVIGATTTQKFGFTVTLAGPAISGTQIFSDTIFTNGVATIKLANGETKTFSEIPVDTTYTVTEATPSNYTCEAFNSSGTIIEDLTQSATFVNTYVPPEVEKVDVTLAKEVVGQFEQESSYRFVAQFANLEAGKTYETSKQGTTFTADAHGTAIIAVTLAAGESLQFIDLPVGSTYLFAEDAGAYISAYQITDANGVSSIVSSAAENQDENVGLSTAVETANEGEAVTVTFINTLRRTANLTLRKEMVSPETDSNRFEFDVTLTGLTPGAKLGSSVGLFIADEEGIAKKTVLLAAGETMEIEGIPVGANYQISENSTKYIAAYQITEGDTNEVIAAGANETQGNSLSTSIETIHEGKNAVVTFTNTFVRPGTVTVTKYDANKQPLSNVPMRLEYSIDNGRTWQPIESRTTPDDGYYPRGLSSTQGIVDGILRTDVNGKATFTGLSVEATIQYRILEVSTQNGLMLMKDPITVSTLPEVKTFDTLDALRTFLAAYNQKTTSYLDYDVDEENLTVRITHAFYELYNTTAIKMPATGGNGFVALPVAFICWAAVLTVLIGEEQRRRKRAKQQ